MNLLQGRKCVSEMINSEKFADDEQQILEINMETRQFISLVKLVFLFVVSFFILKKGCVFGKLKIKQFNVFSPNLKRF